MPVQKYIETTGLVLKEGVERKAIHLTKITTAIVDFSNGPQSSPDPFHSHPHEQITYIASGELNVLIGEEIHHLVKGDLFSVAPNMPHTVQILSKTARLIDSFTPVREDFLIKSQAGKDY